MKDLVVLEYEINMLVSLKFLLSKIVDDNNIYKRVKINAMVESLMLHIRILCDIFLARNKGHSDEITLNKIIQPEDNSDALASLLAELKTSYGKSKEENTPCWTINKMLAHASEERGSKYDYGSIIDKLFPILVKIIKEVNIVLKNEKIENSLSVL